MKKIIMIRYGELSIKGKNKRRFIRILSDNIKRALYDYPQVKVSQQHDFMFLHLEDAPQDKILERLQDVFGIQSYSPALTIERDFEKLKEVAVEVVAKEMAKSDIKTFKIATSRSDHSYRLDTNAINRELGAHVGAAYPELKVQLKQPDLTLRVKVREQDFLLSTDWLPGLGGLPVSSSAKATLMLSGGIDSPVAGYLAMKRGIRVTALHFASPPYTSPQALEKAKKLAGKLSRFSAWINFLEVPFTEIQEEIKEKIPKEYLMTVTRRMMYRVADRLRDQYDGLAIVNGESVGQVASQTLESMYTINEVTSTPILRPLVTMDKLEIIDIAERIDTYDLSIQPFEDCCTVFAPPSPKTKPHLDEVEYLEKRLAIDELVQAAVDQTKFERIEWQDQVEEAEHIADEFEDLL